MTKPVSDKWRDHFFGVAHLTARLSKDTTKVGAVLVGPDRELLLATYNGPPMGVTDSPDRFERPKKYLYASHAEMNLVAFAARRGVETKGCSVYVTHAPCSACARLLIQAGIAEVVVGDGTTSMPKEEFDAATEMFAEAGVTVRRMPEREKRP